MSEFINVFLIHDIPKASRVAHKLSKVFGRFREINEIPLKKLELFN
jgi:hypothetical protein